MPATLTDESTRLAHEAVEWYLSFGVPEAHVRAIALGEVKDERFEAMKHLRDQLTELVMERVAIGRRAFDLLRDVPWDDPTVVTALDRAKVGQTRCTIRAERSTLALFAQVLRERSESLLENSELNGSGRDTARRYTQAARALAAKTKG